jgi:hypothetical protein
LIDGKDLTVARSEVKAGLNFLSVVRLASYGNRKKGIATASLFLLQEW